MPGSSHRLLLLGSAISSVSIGSLPDKPTEDIFISVPGVPQVQSHILATLRAILTGGDGTVGDRRDRERYVTPEILRTIAHLEDTNNVLGFTYRSLAYESLMEQVWVTDSSVAARLMKTCRANRPNFNHFAVAEALLSGEVEAVYTTNFDELIETAVQLLAGIIHGEHGAQVSPLRTVNEALGRTDTYGQRRRQKGLFPTPRCLVVLGILAPALPAVASWLSPLVTYDEGTQTALLLRTQ